MINLLPTKERKALRREYHIRVAVVMMIFALVLELLIAVMFIPAAYTLRLSSRALAAQLERSQGSLPKDVAEVQKQIEGLKRDISTLDASKDMTPTAYIVAISKAKPLGVNISGMVFEPNPTPAIALSGYAASRADLTEFRNTLRANPLFSGADFDAKLLLQEKDIEFNRLIVRIKI